MRAGLGVEKVKIDRVILGLEWSGEGKKGDYEGEDCEKFFHLAWCCLINSVNFLMETSPRRRVIS